MVMTNMSDDPDHPDPAAGDGAGVRSVAPSIRVVEVRELMGEAREVHLKHDGKLYALRITSNNRLILTK